MKFLYPKQRVKRVTDISVSDLLNRGIECLLIDLDNTLTEWNNPQLTKDVAGWLQNLKDHGIKVCIVSNNSNGRVESFACNCQLSWVGKAGKPRRKGFLAGMKQMDSKPEQTAVVGDQIFTDIFGGNRAGLYTILVDPISTREFIGTRIISRTLERFVIKR